MELVAAAIAIGEGLAEKSLRCLVQVGPSTVDPSHEPAILPMLTAIKLDPPPLIAARALNDLIELCRDTSQHDFEKKRADLVFILQDFHNLPEVISPVIHASRVTDNVVLQESLREVLALNTLPVAESPK